MRTIIKSAPALIPLIPNQGQRPTQLEDIMTKVYILESDDWTETWATDGIRGINLYAGDNTAVAVEKAYQYKLENETIVKDIIREWIEDDEVLDALDSLGRMSEEVFLKYIALGDE
jgi:hypothetical protein